MKWIVKSSDDGVCHCKCDLGIAESPGAGQLDCPWCGCGWLFMCAMCGAVFTYGRIAEVDMQPTEIATRMVDHVFGAGKHRDLVPVARDDIASQSSVLGDVGDEVVVIDGRVLPLTYRYHGAGFIGRYGVHHLQELPQALTRDPNELVRAFGREYWKSLDRAVYRS